MAWSHKWAHKRKLPRLVTATPMATQDLLSRITVDPEICHGKPCIRGRRYPVEFILELLSSGMTEQEILEDYDDLEREDLLAVYAYAAKLSRVKSVVPVAA